MTDEAKTACRSPAEGKDGVVNIPTWKYEAVRAAILEAVGAAGPAGLPFADLAAAVRTRLDAEVLARLGSVGWHTTTVKLNMEVAGELRRKAGRGPQRLVL